jgi:hypothetical protein
MAKYDEVEVIARAYDELKALDCDGRVRALEWLASRFENERLEGRRAREQAARERIAVGKSAPLNIEGESK